VRLYGTNISDTQLLEEDHVLINRHHQQYGELLIPRQSKQLRCPTAVQKLNNEICLELERENNPNEDLIIAKTVAWQGQIYRERVEAKLI
jgi:hypothetical protein